MKNSVFERVETDPNLPFDVTLHNVNYVPNHWHNSIEIIFVLKGNLEVTINHDKYAISEGDVLLINFGHIHEVIGIDQNIIATFQIPIAYLKENVKGIENVNFDVFSGGPLPQEKKPILFIIRRLLAEMVQVKYKKDEAYELEMAARMLKLFAILLKQFKISAPEGIINEKNMERMLRIITYIDEHYQEPITLQTIAEREFLSLPYLSKFFKENIGLNFTSYVTSIRLKNAVEDLLHNREKPIAEIASFHGFSTMKSFYTAFKEKYHVTPNEYRKQYQPKVNVKNADKLSFNYLAFNQSSALGIISQYLNRSTLFEVPDVPSIETKNVMVDMARKTQKIKHTWKNLITIGKAKEGLHRDVQDQIRYLQQKCPFRYLRFHGIFDDAMMVYYEDDEENPIFNFRLVDQLFDFLLSIGLKPFVELGFMPSDLASDKSKTVFYKKSYISPPKSLDRWCKLVDRFIRHCLNRYGLREVESWKFEFWNEPELHIFWSGTVAEYLDFYRRTYETIKLVSRNLQIGAPGRIITISSPLYQEDFFTYCREHNCLPDFIPVHFYPHELICHTMDQENQAPAFLIKAYDQALIEFIGISPNPDLLADALENEKKMLAEAGLGELEIYLTEWNSTTYHRDLTNDTLYKAAYIVKNIVENLDRIDGFGYWVLSDNIEETAASPDIFHGGLGIIAQNGIPKAGMFAYELLAKLGDELITKDKGYVVTSGGGGYQILTYHYCHFDDLYAMGDTSFINETNRYNGFKDHKTLKMEIGLTDIPSGKYKMVKTVISRQNGSSYDKWVEMGAPKALTEEDIAYLKAVSKPQRSIHYQQIDGEWTYVSTLESHEVALLELWPLF
ncbi:helix-turn-helix domain-containing protein [Bacillus sp. IITD106]|nr:helix-turn-helix domain-containing protein [Bacillus sp. IITD106]